MRAARVNARARYPLKYDVVAAFQCQCVRSLGSVGWVFFAENTLWHSLFGLLFWDELFESDLLHSSFDWVPHCLNDRSFAHRFAAQIDDKLQAVRSGSAFNLLLRPIAANWGRPNGIFAGTTSMSTRCERCCRESAG